MPIKRENKEVENIVVENEFVNLDADEMEPLKDEDNEGAMEDIDEDENSSIEDEDEDEGDFGVEKDDDDEEEDIEHPLGDDDDDEDEEGDIDEEDDDDDEGSSASKKQKGGVVKAKGKRTTKAVPEPTEEVIQYGIDSDDDEEHPGQRKEFQ